MTNTNQGGIEMAKIISFMNMKGGVGKSTLCLSLGYHLAKYQNKKILFIDLDPQFNLTQTFLNEYRLTEPYLNDEFKEKDICNVFLTEAPTLGEKPKPPNSEDIIHNLDDNLDIVFGSIYLIKIDNSEDKKYKLQNFIKENKLRDFYDYILIDCPPTISLYTSAALHCADYYIVPNMVDRYSILGIKLLDDAIKQEGVSSNRDLLINPLGIIYTMLSSNPTDRSQSIMREFENDAIVQKMGLFQEPFTYSNHLIEGMQGNIASKYENSKKSIEKICKEFIERLEEDER